MPLLAIGRKRLTISVHCHMAEDGSLAAWSNVWLVPAVYLIANFFISLALYRDIPNSDSATEAPA